MLLQRHVSSQMFWSFQVHMSASASLQQALVKKEKFSTFTNTEGIRKTTWQSCPASVSKALHVTCILAYAYHKPPVLEHKIHLLMQVESWLSTQTMFGEQKDRLHGLALMSMVGELLW